MISFIHLPSSCNEDFFFVAAEPLPLMDLCRRVIRQQFNKDQLEEKVSQLNLPPSLVCYLLFKERR